MKNKKKKRKDWRGYHDYVLLLVFFCFGCVFTDLFDRLEETLLIEDFELLLYKEGGLLVGIGEVGGVVIDIDLICFVEGVLITFDFLLALFVC